MLLKCPSCGSQIRLTTPQFKEKVIRYLCQNCDNIVSLDLVSDEIHSSSSAHRPEDLHHPQRILVADDSDSFRSVASALLSREGYVVITAQDGVEALRKITEEHPDAVLLDLSMPRMTGFEVLNNLRSNPGYKNFRNIPVLITSGVYNQAEVEIVHDLRANGYIPKDAIPQMLIYRIRQILEKGQEQSSQTMEV